MSKPHNTTTAITPITVPQNQIGQHVDQSFEVNNLEKIANALAEQITRQNDAEDLAVEVAGRTGLFLVHVREHCARGTLEALLRLLGAKRSTAKANMRIAQRFLAESTEAAALALEVGKAMTASSSSAGQLELELFAGGQADSGGLPSQLKEQLKQWVSGRTRSSLLKARADAHAEAEEEDAVEVTTTPVARGKRVDGEDALRGWELERAAADEAWQAFARYLDAKGWQHQDAETLRTVVTQLEHHLPSLAEALAEKTAEEVAPKRNRKGAGKP